MMQVKEISKIIFLVILALYLMTAGSAAATVISINSSTGQVANFASIQAAVNAANPGDRLIVKPGIYEENIAINKSISIASESGNFSNTIVQAANVSQDIFSILANGVSIKGFGINGSDSAGIHLFGVIDCRIENNKLSNDSCGIDLYMMSSDNRLDKNGISDCMTGISLGGCWNNSLSNNSISNCSNGISLFDSPNNILKNNTISENIEGISLAGESNGNNLTNNNVILNEKRGLYIYETSNNLIYNNYFNNTINVESETYSNTNVWNTTKTEGTNIAGGSYLGGNIWARPDGKIYPDGVRDNDLDGILDSQYNAEGDQFIDYLPLKELKPVILTVNNSTGPVADFTSIQAAIDNAHPGDIVRIFPGIYEENVDVYVTNLTLTSEPVSGDTIVKAVNSLDDIFYIIADGVTISGLNITGSVNFPNAGIHLNGVKYCNIKNNQLYNNYSSTTLNISSENNSLNFNNSSSNAGFGVRLDSSSINILDNNTVSGNGTSILLRNSTENTLINNSAFGGNYGIWMDFSSNNSLEGNNLSNNEVGTYLNISRGNVINNSKVSNNTDSGIDLYDSVGNTLSNSTASNNNVSVILQNSSANLLNNNNVYDNEYGFWLDSSSNANKLDNNTASNNSVGIRMKASGENILTGNIVLNNTLSGINVWNSTENIFINNVASNNNVSISLQNCSKNTLFNNTVSSSIYGMRIAFSSNNILSDNNISNNKFGLYLKNSTDNRLSGNWANSNTRHGIYLGFSRSNMLNSNRVVSNWEYGLYLLNAENSSIYDNYFNNTNNTYLKGSNAGTSLNTTLTQAKNILNGPYVGGNFWATPEGNGFSQTHADNNGDGICDEAYAVDIEDTDYLPLAGSYTAN